MAPINLTNLYPPSDGTVPPRVIDYYVERAKGGVGLIITGVFKVENEVENYVKDGMRIWQVLTPMALPGLAELADQVHSFGAKLFLQLSAGPGRVARGDVIDAGFKPVSASANPAFYRPNVICRELRTEEVEKIVEAFGRVAQWIANVGVDGVEVHGHEGYLIDQFNTSLWNRRTDKYGGDLKARLSFAVEILKQIRKMAGEDFPVTFRLGIKHFIKEPWKSSLRPGGFVEVGRDVSESIEAAKILEKAGYDALHIDAGCYDSLYWAHPPTYQPDACTIDLIKGLKEVVKVPVLTANKLGDPKIAEGVLQGKIADMIALARPLLADPQWPTKVREEREEEIRPCIGCHEGCFRIPASLNRPTSCSVNPSCGKERNYPSTRSDQLKKIVVIGGGVAGMEVARMAAQRGHHVLLFEKEGNLGGHLREAAVPHFKKDLKRLLDWYERQMIQQKVELHLNEEVTPGFFDDLNFDLAVLATGSTPSLPPVPGIQKPLVTNCCEVLSGKREVGRRVVILGGGLEGCETAIWLAQKGNSVCIVEMLDTIANGIHLANRLMLLDMIEDLKIQVLTGSSIAEVFDGGVDLLDKNSKRRFMECDSLVLGVGLQPVRTLCENLRKKAEAFYEIGDCKTPRNIHHAILEGFNVGYYL